MKSSNSRDKNMKTQAPMPPSSNKLMKTDIHQPKREQLEKTNYNRPSSGKKIQSSKAMPPKAPTSKKQYIIEDNMTDSRINEAKQGLQLLKKKMSSKGLSREKTNYSNQKQSEKTITSMKLVQNQKNQENEYYQNRNNNNMPPKNTQKTQNKIPSNRNTRNVQTQSKQPTPQNNRKMPIQQQQYRDAEMQIPIKPKKDFNALLEEQFRKQKQNSGSFPSSQQKKPAYTPKQMNQYPEPGNQQLVQCRHCQRKFIQSNIQKHQKICLKVFMSKRKAFDSAAYRAPQVQNVQQNLVQKPKKKQQTNTKTQNKKVEQPINKKQEAIPKWKAASLAFRANLKNAKGATLTAEQKQANDIAQGMVQCNYCGRKFNDKAASRHIAFCQTKSKQLPKMNMKKK